MRDPHPITDDTRQAGAQRPAARACTRGLPPMYLTVTTTAISPNTGKNMWFIMHVTESNLRAVMDQLTEKGLILGDRIEVRSQGARTIEVDREPHILGLGAVFTLRECHLEFEASDAVPA